MRSSGLTPHFSKVSAFNQIRDVLGRFLSACVDSHLPPAQDNPYANVAYFGRLPLYLINSAETLFLIVRVASLQESLII